MYVLLLFMALFKGKSLFEDSKPFRERKNYFTFTADTFIQSDFIVSFYTTEQLKVKCFVGPGIRTHDLLIISSTPYPLGNHIPTTNMQFVECF